MTEPPRTEHFEAIVGEYAPMVTRIIAAFESRTALQRELVQEVFVAVWAALARFRGKAGIKTYVARIAHNVAVSHVRREVRHPIVSGEVDLADSTPGPAQRAEHDAIREALLAAVRQLPVGLRQVVSLHLEGFTDSEIAAALQISGGNVAVRLTRARDRLRNALRSIA
ncbi:MAG: sigma-70 family RNA polymerase sigma factor [Pseudomonadota bacterium]